MPYKDIVTRRRKQRERYWSSSEVREAHKLRAKRRYHADPESAHLDHILRRYGLAPSDYYALLVKQNYLCAICGGKCSKTGRFKHFHVDHDHVTGKVRGLLCFNCNLRLGWLEANKSAIESYLDNSA